MAKDSFLPTMPQDIIFDIKNAIISGNKTDSPKFYGNYKKCQFFVKLVNFIKNNSFKACPNGHPYVLFDVI